MQRNSFLRPFNQGSAARLYKTGDLARYLPDGNIVFLGRLDDQIKLRGFRIELSEIETVLREHPEVKDAVILSCEALSAHKQLVAYIVPDDRAPDNSVEVDNSHSQPDELRQL